MPDYPKVLFQNRKPDRIATLAEYRQSGGYEGLKNALERFSHKDVREILLDAMLLGRGGAAFPTGRKIMTTPENAPFPRYVVCNADEMEPGTFKDRVMIHADPHMLIEGMAITGYAMQAQQGFIFIRPEYENAARILEREIELAKADGLLGKDIFGAGYDFDIAVHRSGGRYICGEGTALLNALEGKRPNPRKPPPFPTDKGLWQLPTDVQNVETLCCMPHILRNGAKWFRELALTENASGTKLFSVSGRVNKPGCYELPMGVKLSEIIEVHAGGMSEGSIYKACLPGGASTKFLPEQYYHIRMDYESFKQQGHRLGTGAVMVFDQHTCLVAATVNLMAFFARESCGWCTPCREGIPFLLDLLERIENGEGEERFIPMLRNMSGHMYHAYCAFAAGAAAPLEGLLDYFEEEVREHIRMKRCPFAAPDRSMQPSG